MFAEAVAGLRVVTVFPGDLPADDVLAKTDRGFGGADLAAAFAGVRDGAALAAFLVAVLLSAGFMAGLRDCVVDDFLRVFLDIRLPFVAFGWPIIGFAIPHP
jgi:hypothetical protein